MCHTQWGSAWCNPRADASIAKLRPFLVQNRALAHAPRTRDSPGKNKNWTRDSGHANPPVHPLPLAAQPPADLDLPVGLGLVPPEVVEVLVGQVVEQGLAGRVLAGVRLPES